MRGDIGKVVFERAKTSRTWASKTPRVKQIVLDAEGEQLNESANSIRRKRQKWRNSHFNALERFLGRSIGRPWSAVYAEICTVADSRSRLGRELRDHANYIVATQCWFDGARVMTSDCGCPREVHGLYVHPTTGVLRQTPGS